MGDFLLLFLQNPCFQKGEYAVTGSGHRVRYRDGYRDRHRALQPGSLTLQVSPFIIVMAPADCVSRRQVYIRW